MPAAKRGMGCSGTLVPCSTRNYGWNRALVRIYCHAHHTRKVLVRFRFGRKEWYNNELPWSW